MSAEKKQITFEWAFRFVMLVIISIGAWFGREVWAGQKEIISRLNRMDVEQATVAANRFTSMDWVSAKASIDSQIGMNERRIFKLETAIESILKSQERIEKSLNQK